MEPSSPPLAGVLVLDLTRAVTGPFCTMTLADLGARVIKVEEPGTGDETRHWGPPFVDGESAYFLGVNRGKESIELNLKEPRDLEIARRLAAKADVVIENFRPGVADRLGVGYEQLRAANPKLIYASISGFGQTGPFREKPGYDLLAQALSGFMRLSASPGGPPVKAGFPVADILAGMFAGQAILAALYRRQRTGEGAYVEIALLESILAAMCSISAQFLLTGQEPVSMGIGQSNIVPYQVFQCQDESIIIGAPNDRLWQRFCQALDQPGWLAEERYATNASRTVHRAELVTQIEAVLAARPAADWLRRLEEFEVPCAPINSLGRIFSHPQVLARNFAVEVDHSRLGPIKLVGSPLHFAGFEPPRQAPPLLGEHTEKILSELDHPVTEPRP